MAYKVIIEVPVNGKPKMVQLDTVTERSVDSSMTLASQPIQSGSVLTDHAYRNPTMVSLDGTFSNRGSWTILGDHFTSDYLLGTEVDDVFLTGEGAELKDLGDSSMRLKNIQIFFEWIMTRGVLVDIYMIDMNENGEQSETQVPRFKIRRNMALKGAKWRENYNSMTYSFQFQEVLITSVSKFETSKADSLYPNVDLPPVKSLGEVLMNTDNLAEQVLEILFGAGYMDALDGSVFVGYANDGRQIEVSNRSLALGQYADKSEFWGTSGRGFLTSLAGLVGVSLVAVNAIIPTVVMGLVAGAVTAGAILSATGIGALVVIGIAATIGLIYGIKESAKRKERNRRLAQGINLIYDYKRYIVNDDIDLSAISNAEPNYDDIRRLKQLLDTIINTVKTEMRDVQFYQISTSEVDNDERSFALTCGNDFLYGSITRTVKQMRGRFEEKTLDETTYGYRLHLYHDIEKQNEIKVMHPWSPVTDMSQANRATNAVYIDSSMEYEMYLVNPASAFKEVDDPTDNLKDYYLMICKGNISDTWNRLQQAIVTCLKNNNFEVD